VGLAVPLRPDGPADYRRDAAELYKALCSLDGGMGWYADRTTPYPLTLTVEDVAELGHMYGAIARGITRVVERYLDDPRLRSVITLPPDLIALLERVDGLPYRSGALRPDFLIDTAGEFRVCEVNARFPTNGFMCSYFTNEAVDGLGYLAGAPARSVPGLHAALDALCSRFQPGEPLVVLLDREPGTEIFLLLDELRRRGIDAHCRRPAELAVSDGVVTDGGRFVDQFILELERDELLDMPLELFDAVAASQRSFNDVRTVIVGHDKRILAVLSRPELVADLLDAPDVDVLSRHLIPTFHAAEVGDALLADPSAWVLKRNSSGRGIDLLVGATCPPDAWRQAVLQQAEDRTAQAFVDQRTFAMPTIDDDGRLVDEQMHVVGLLPGFDGELLGPGLCRASARSVINVAGGRGALVPTMLALQP
jgi:hypothetical protein